MTATWTPTEPDLWFVFDATAFYLAHYPDGGRTPLWGTSVCLEELVEEDLCSPQTAELAEQVLRFAWRAEARMSP